jgi:hypothetical protein
MEAGDFGEEEEEQGILGGFHGAEASCEAARW